MPLRFDHGGNATGDRITDRCHEPSVDQSSMRPIRRRSQQKLFHAGWNKRPVA